MSETLPTSPPEPVIRRSRPYLRLLFLIPALAMLGTGLYYHYNVEEGGQVTGIKLTTKQGMVGQAAEAVANVKPTTPDLYLKIFTAKGETQLPVFKDTPIGNGLMWSLPKTFSLHEVQRVEVWNQNRIMKDDHLDRITLAGWSTDGQQFHVDLMGERIVAPKWALPLAAVGAALSLLVLLRFVWDQVI